MYIVLRNLRANGFSWELTATPLVIGRGHGCEIRVFDSELSRRHARVWLQDGLVRFEDLGSSNATLVNGVPAVAGTLKPGDTLAAGSTVFVISEKTELADDTQTQSGETPITLSARLESYVRAPGASMFAPLLHRTVHELHDLFHLGRLLGAIETVHELTELVGRTLREQFEPEDLWIAWRYADNQPLVIDGVGSSDREKLPLKLLERAINSREGVVSPSVQRRGAARVLHTHMAVPMVHADQALGGFALFGRTPGRTYTEEDLHYALGIAAIAAPHVRAVRHAEQLRRDNKVLQARVGGGAQLLGESIAMSRVRNTLSRAGAGTLPVLLLGETGTGKEIAARVLHEASPRREGPYVVVNCAAIPDHLFESEFFGHEAGAFTGATAQRLGFFEEAHGGTLFLDEVGDLSLDNQARILRAIETGTFRRVGGNKLIHVDVRILSATNKDLTAPAFRQDLLHRINGVIVQMPPLRERPEDIPALAEHFLRSSAMGGHIPVTGIEAAALFELQRQPWPGNVRELKTVIDRAALFANRPILDAEDFALPIAGVCESDTGAVQSSDSCDKTLLQPLAAIERQHIQRTLEACRGNIAESARILGINRATLYRRIAEFGIAQGLDEVPQDHATS